jgi:hypothetical protein
MITWKELNQIAQNLSVNGNRINPAQVLRVLTPMLESGKI